MNNQYTQSPYHGVSNPHGFAGWFRFIPRQGRLPEFEQVENLPDVAWLAQSVP